MTIEAAFGPHEALARAQCLFATYGHMYPKWKSIYLGHIDVAVDNNNDYVVVDWDLRDEEGKELPCSPRFYEDSNDFACDQCPSVNPNRQAGLYRFSGSYCWTDETDKNQNGFEIRGEPIRAGFPIS